jgi:hypothetical protein
VKRATLLSVMFLGLAGWAIGQAPAGTTFTWSQVQDGKGGMTTSPRFGLVAGTNKTELNNAQGTLEIPIANGLHKVNEVKFQLWVAAGPGVWNTKANIDSLGTAGPTAVQNVWTIVGEDPGNPKLQYDQTVDVKVQFQIEAQRVPSVKDPNPPKLTFVVGTKIVKPTPP